MRPRTELGQQPQDSQERKAFAARTSTLDRTRNIGCKEYERRDREDRRCNGRELQRDVPAASVQSQQRRRLALDFTSKSDRRVVHPALPDSA